MVRYIRAFSRGLLRVVDFYEYFRIFFCEVLGFDIAGFIFPDRDVQNELVVRPDSYCIVVLCDLLRTE